MSIMNNGFATINAKGANIIARFDDAELVAVLHSNGFVALYAEDEGELMQMSHFRRNDNADPMETAKTLMGL